MGEDVQRFILQGKPRHDNRKYYTWQTATIIVFVAESNKPKALERLHEILDQHRWQLVAFEGKATLIEDRVREQGEEVWKGFLKARERGYFLIEFPNHSGAGKRKGLIVLAPRIDEKFVDQLVSRAGGRRLTAQERNFERTENADYLIDDCVIELKEIREEGLEKATRQEKIAKLFLPYFPEDDDVPLDPSVLSEQDRQVYLDLIGQPIQNQIKKASRQLRHTKEELSNQDLRGAVIMINSGYSSLPAELFEDMCLRYAAKDSTQIEEVYCISTWFLTNGLESEVFSQFFPQYDALSPLGRKLVEAYDKQLADHMTRWAQSGFGQFGDMHTPMETVAFNYQGKNFYWLPPIPPKSWESGR